jgi:hypothetical protein
VNNIVEEHVNFNGVPQVQTSNINRAQTTFSEHALSGAAENVKS